MVSIYHFKWQEKGILSSDREWGLILGLYNNYTNKKNQYVHAQGYNIKGVQHKWCVTYQATGIAEVV